jgi:hypothetical protein
MIMIANDAHGQEMKPFPPTFLTSVLRTLIREHPVQEREYSPLPKRVASVHQFVRPPLESALQPHLAVGRPAEEAVSVAQLGLAHQDECGEAAETERINQFVIFWTQEQSTPNISTKSAKKVCLFLDLQLI